MKKEEQIVFEVEGVTYTYHFAVTEYDGNKLVKWKDCVWKPNDKNNQEE